MGRLILRLHIPEGQRDKGYIIHSHASPHIVSARSTVRNCIWCTLDFTSSRCFIPIKVVDKRFVGFGTFCSYNCAYTYLSRDGEGITNTAQSLTLLHAMYHREYGKYCTFKTMPHRAALAKYNDGVGITEEEFKENVNAFGSILVTKFPKPHIELVEHEMCVTNYGSFSVKRRR